MRVELHVPEGVYIIEDSRWPIISLLVEVFKHRLWHWWMGDGFRD